MPSQISKDLLRIPSQNGSPINEYRIHEGEIEFRALNTLGQTFSPMTEGWRTLDAADIQLHFALNTTVAKWLVERLEALAHNA